MNKIVFSSIKYTARKRMFAPGTRILAKTVLYSLMLLPLWFLILRLTGYVDYITAVMRECGAYLMTDYADALDGATYEITREVFQQAFMDAALAVPMPDVKIFGVLLAFCVGYMMLILRAGYVLCTLKVSRREQVKVKDLLYGFWDFLRVAGVELLRTLIVTAGLLLLIVPGVILRYRYRFALRLLADHPEMKAKDALAASAKLTRGHKWRLFLLDLSYIFWYAADIALRFVTVIPVVHFWLLPYSQVTLSMYYNEVVGWRPEEHPQEDGK